MRRAIMKRDNDTNKLSRKFSPLTVVLLVVLILYSLTVLGMIFYAVMTSLKLNTNAGYRYNKSTAYSLPTSLHFENFKAIFENFFIKDVPKAYGTGTKVVKLTDMYLYTVLYCLGSALCQTTVQCVTAYLCAKFKYKLSKVVETIVIVVMIIPVVGSLPSEIQVSRDLGLYNHIFGMWVMKANFLGMYFLIFIGVFKNISMTYTEAAKIDGASNASIMLKIIFPLVRNVFLTVVLVNFIAFWKDYQTPLIYLESFPTVSYGLWQILFLSTPTNGMGRVPMRMAGSVLVVLPLIIVFLIFQKRLLGNLTMGGIKG